MRSEKSKNSRLIVWLLVGILWAVHVYLVWRTLKPVEVVLTPQTPEIVRIAPPKAVTANIDPALQRALEADAGAESAAIDFEEMTEDVSEIYEADWAEKVH